MQHRIFRAALVVSALILLAYVALLVTVNSAKFQDWMEAEIANRTGYHVSIREMRLDPLLRLSLMGVTASSATGPAIQAERVIIVPGPAALFTRSIRRLQLEKPVLRFDPYEFFGAPRKEPLALSIGRLRVDDGTLVIMTGKNGEVEFRSVTMNAENVNLGEGLGVHLRAAVPWLDGIATLTIEGGGGQIAGVIRLEQTSETGATNPSRGKSRRTSETHIKLTRTADGPVRVTAQGKFDAARFMDTLFTGEVNAEAEFGPDSKEVAFNARAVAAELPAGPTVLPVPLPKGQATLKLRGAYELATRNLSVASLELTSPLGEASGQGQVSFDPAPAWKQAQLALRKVAVENFKPLLPSPMNTMVIGGAAEADLEVEGPWLAPVITGMARVSGVKLQNGEFSLAELNVETPVRWTDGDFRAGDARLSGRKLLLQGKKQIRISAEAVRMSGIVEKKRSEAIKAAGTVSIQQGAFASADGSKIGEKLALEARIDSLQAGGENGLLLAGKFDIARGEVLWGTFYGDLESRHPTLEFDGEYRPNRDLLRLRRANLSLASVGQVALKGDIENISKDPAARLDIKSDAIQSAGLFQFFIRETLNRSYPILDRLAVAGVLSLSAKANGPLGEPTVEGVVTLRRGELRARSNDWHLGGIEIVLPFRLHYPAAPAKAIPPRVATGTIGIESAKFGTEVVPGIKSTLSLWNNVLRFHQPIRLSIYGGSLVLANLAWTDVIATPRALSLSLEAKDLQLRQLTENLDWHRFGGTLSGSIPKIEWTEGSLRSQGQIDVAVFGGRLRMNQLEVEAPFSAVPAIKLAARFQDIQLEQASETFAFGRISGVLAGTVDDLVVSARQPSSFSADVYSVEKSGVSQRISVESLNKITVLSSGQDAGAVYGGIAGFFDSFRYSKLGFKAALKNDKLTLRGVESRGGKEYLVVGSLIPPTVNIISHTQEIAFLELVRRLERIQKSDAPKKTVQ